MIYVISILTITIIYVLLTYNKLIKLNNNVNEAFSTMDVSLKKRWDLVPNLVEIVKGYAKYESETLNQIINFRSGIYDNLNNDEKLKTNEKITNEISKLLAMVENYPELKANENFLNLSKDLKNIEDEISKSRRYFNAVVREYNNKVEMIPSNIIAKIFNYKKKQMFMISQDERENIKVNLQ